MERITVEWVRERVERIRTVADDDEMAHSWEDDLHGEVLAAIADGRCDDPAACAREALRTSEVEFQRWCA